jgi:nucleoporin POM152
MNTRSHATIGAHTVRMSPISTAQLNPEGISVCISPGSPVSIPVLFNNTSPTSLRYSLSPLSGSADAELFELGSRDLRQASRVIARPASSALVQDEYDDDDEDDLRDTPSLQKTQSLAQIQVSTPGVLRLDRVVHSSSVASRITGQRSMIIAPCPGAVFVDEMAEESPIRCASERKDLDMQIRIDGVPPLTLRWSKNAPDGKVQDFKVENIGHGTDAPDSVVVPLSVSATIPGVHAYVLESVSDGLGNFMKLGRSSSRSATNTKTTRSVHILQTPRVSFVSRSCSLANPARLLVGSTVKLPIHVVDLDPLDGPLQVQAVYQPSAEEEALNGQKALSWTRDIYIEDSRHNAHVFAEHPGQYQITTAKGRYCQAEILNPDICEVTEIPKPSAQIEWKPIHEWCVPVLLLMCASGSDIFSALAMLGSLHHCC